MTMRILFVNNDGGGFADYINVNEGKTVEQFFKDQMPDRRPEDYLIRVNRQPVPRDYVSAGERSRHDHANQDRRAQCNSAGLDNTSKGICLPPVDRCPLPFEGVPYERKGIGACRRPDPGGSGGTAKEPLPGMCTATEPVYRQSTRDRPRFPADGAGPSRGIGLPLRKSAARVLPRHLGQIPYSVSKLESLLDRRHKEVPSLGTILAELKAIQEEFDDVAFNGEEDSLSVITEPITLEDTYLGPFRIALFLGKLHQMQHHVPYYVIRYRAPSGRQRRGDHPSPRQQ